MRNNKGMVWLEGAIILVIVSAFIALILPLILKTVHKADAYQEQHTAGHYNYDVTQFTADGRVLNNYHVANFYMASGAAHLTLESGIDVIIAGTFTITEKK